MKLSTKTLFTTIKNSQRKQKNIHKVHKSSPFVNLNNKIKIGNINLNEKLSPINLNDNPFLKTQTCSNHIKNRKVKRIIKSKNKKPNLELEDDLFEKDSFDHNIIFTDESDTNNFNNYIMTENRIINKDEQEIDALCGLFRKSNLNTAIVIDNRGNNNLDEEQKKMVDNYFKKKSSINLNKNKINSIPVETYKENKTLFTKFNKKIFYSSKKSFIKFNDEEMVNLNGNKNKKNQYKLKSYIKELCQPNSDFRKFIEVKKDLIKEKNDLDNNSIFEKCTNKSIDSSFLGSSLDDYQGFADNKT